MNLVAIGGAIGGAILLIAGLTQIADYVDRHNPSRVLHWLASPFVRL